MFTVTEAPSKGPLGDHKMVVDEGRNVWLQRVTELHMGAGSVFKLVWDHRTIPFDALLNHSDMDEASRQKLLSDGAPPDRLAEWIYTWRFHHFGFSAVGEAVGGPAAYRFVDEAEREAARLLAIEAVLAYGSNYDGDKRWTYRFEYKGRVYNKTDFRQPFPR